MIVRALSRTKPQQRRPGGRGPYRYWCLYVLSQLPSGDWLALRDLYAQVHESMKSVLTASKEEEWISPTEQRWQNEIRHVLYRGDKSLKQRELVRHLSRPSSKLQITEKGRELLKKYSKPPSWDVDFF